MKSIQLKDETYEWLYNHRNTKAKSMDAVIDNLIKENDRLKLTLSNAGGIKNEC